MELAQDEKDRRRKLVRITGSGRELAVGLAPAVVAVNEEMLSPFSPGEREQFLGLLRRAAQRRER